MASILEEIDTKLFNLLDIRIRPMTKGGEADKIGIVGFVISKFLTDKSVFKSVLWIRALIRSDRHHLAGSRPASRACLFVSGSVYRYVPTLPKDKIKTYDTDEKDKTM
jgi:hypothetical protein